MPIDPARFSILRFLYFSQSGSFFTFLISLPKPKRCRAFSTVAGDGCSRAISCRMKQSRLFRVLVGEMYASLIRRFFVHFSFLAPSLAITQLKTDQNIFSQSGSQKSDIDNRQCRYSSPFAKNHTNFAPNKEKTRFLGLFCFDGGADGDRTHDLLHAMEALSQLSYSPVKMLFQANEILPKKHFLVKSLIRVERRLPGFVPRIHHPWPSPGHRLRWPSPVHGGRHRSRHRWPGSSFRRC